MKLFTIFVLAILLVQVIAEASSSTHAGNSLTSVDGTYVVSLHHHKHHHHYHRKINCNYACSRRCSKSSRKNVCHRACKTCCERCHCVPPGTYGNQSACPCYASLRTHGNKLKCP